MEKRLREPYTDRRIRTHSFPSKHVQVKRRMEEEEERGMRARKRMSSPELWEARQLIASGACV